MMNTERGGGLQLTQPRLKAVEARQNDLIPVDPEAQHDMNFKD